MPADILNRIVEEKWREVQARRQVLSLADLESMAGRAEAPRGFAAELRERVSKRQPAVIAEMKKASPSKGVIREHFDPVAIATAYETAGAACLSVLTDISFFHGSDDNLARAKQAAGLPVLRKDFIVDPYQVYESRAIGADCILLIAAILSRSRMKTLYDLAKKLDMDVLVEVHNADELEKAVQVSPDLVGINNRDLRTFDVDLGTTHTLAERVPEGALVVTESGIHDPADVASMMERGIYAFLVGEAFMVEENPGDKLRALFYQRVY